MKNSLTVVSAKGHYEFCAAYLSERGEFDKNILLVVSFRGGMVAEKILASDSVRFFDEIFIFEPIPDSTHGLNKIAMQRTLEKYLEFENSTIGGYSFQSIFWGVLTILPIYNFLYYRIRSQNPKSKQMMMDDGTATYMLQNKKLFKYMTAPSNKKIKSLGAQIIRKEIDFPSVIKILFVKATSYVPKPNYGDLFKYEENTFFNMAIVKRKDLFEKPSFMRIDLVEEFLPNTQKPDIKLECGSFDPKIPMLIDQSFGMPMREHIKVLDKVFSKRKVKKIYMKLHPKERANYIGLLGKIETKTSFVVVDMDADAEEIVRSFGVDTVFGFNSTALFNVLNDCNVELIFNDYLKLVPLRLHAQLFFRIIFMSIVYNEMIHVYSLKSKKINLKNLYFKRLIGIPFCFGKGIQKSFNAGIGITKKWVDSKFVKKIKRGNAINYDQIFEMKKSFAEKYCHEINNNLFLFESFNGRYACSPKAIFEKISKKNKYLGVRFVWAISKDIDEGAQYKLNSYKSVDIVAYGSSQHKEALSKAKLIVTNSRLPRYFLRKEEQIVLQTWHGTPFKKDAMSILSSVQEEQLNYRKMVNDADVSNYTYLLAQNEFSVECFKDTFDVVSHPHVNIVDTGYPRNDRLVSEKDNQKEIARLKEIFSLPLDKKIILFAPTWRDHHKKKSKAMAKYWDFEMWREKLNENYHVIFRGHYFFKDSISLNEYNGFITDISKHNDINDLLLVSDILVTDYSSCMFDFSVLQKPMYFFMPDYVVYTNLSRKLHLDPYVELPGPVLKNNNDLIDSIINDNACKYKNKYSDFLRRFNYMDDGNATERTISLIENALH